MNQTSKAKQIFLLLAITFFTLFTFSGCGHSDRGTPMQKPNGAVQSVVETSEPQSKLSESTSSATESTPDVSETPSYVVVSYSEGEMKANEIIQEKFDLDAYTADSYGNLKYTCRENKLDNAIDEITIDGKLLKIGASYADVINLGFTPTEEDFENTSTKHLAYSCVFRTDSGKGVRLGFIGEDDDTVKNGVLYSVGTRYYDTSYSIMGTRYTDGMDENQVGFSIGNLSNTTTLSEALSLLGDPYCILAGDLNDTQPLVELEYQFSNRSVYLDLSFDLETEELLGVSLQGYAE